MLTEAEMIKKVDQALVEIAGTKDVSQIFNQPERYRRLAETLWAKHIRKVA